VRIKMGTLIDLNFIIFEVQFGVGKLITENPMSGI
jgi:hypothetical protein